MSVEHRRQLLAFFIVALAAFLLIGNGLHAQFGRGDGSAREAPAIAAIAAGPTISTGSSRVDAGGSARGTTAVEPAAAPARSGRTTSVTSPPLRAAPGQSNRAPRAERAVQRSKSSAQKHATQRSARSASDDQVTIRARSTDDGKKAHAKKHGKKNGKKGHKQRRHGR
jgi:hypothetical protein